MASPRSGWSASPTPHARLTTNRRRVRLDVGAGISLKTQELFVVVFITRFCFKVYAFRQRAVPTPHAVRVRALDEAIRALHALSHVVDMCPVAGVFRGGHPVRAFFFCRRRLPWT